MPTPRRPPMATKKIADPAAKTAKTVETLEHDEARRRNIPTAEYQAVLDKAKLAPVEVRHARDLQHLLGYAEWSNFGTVLNRAKTACEVSGHPVPDHFVDVAKMVDMGYGVQREAVKGT